MDSAIPLLLFLGLLMGFGVLVLACGIQSREEERAAPCADPRRKPDLLANARYFARAGNPALADPAAVVVDRAVLERVEAYVRTELALAEVYVEDPSVEKLHESTAGESRESLLQRLEGFLSREEALVAEFVSNPSIARLYESADPVAVAV